MKTKKEVLKAFSKRGETIIGWAEKNGYKPRTVYAVLNGQIKGLRGKGHEIAVGLGLKDAPRESAQ
jgi:gp16 family phage-associated protein